MMSFVYYTMKVSAYWTKKTTLLTQHKSYLQQKSVCEREQQRKNQLVVHSSLWRKSLPGLLKALSTVENISPLAELVLRLISSSSLSVS